MLPYPSTLAQQNQIFAPQFGSNIAAIAIQAPDLSGYMKASEKAKESSVKTVNQDAPMGLTDSAVAILQPITHHRQEQAGSEVASEFHRKAQGFVQVNTIPES